MGVIWLQSWVGWIVGWVPLSSFGKKNWHSISPLLRHWLLVSLRLGTLLVCVCVFICDCNVLGKTTSLGLHLSIQTLNWRWRCTYLWNHWIWSVDYTSKLIDCNTKTFWGLWDVGREGRARTGGEARDGPLGSPPPIAILPPPIVVPPSPPLHSPPPSPRQAAWNHPQEVPFPPLTICSNVKMGFFQLGCTLL